MNDAPTRLAAERDFEHQMRGMNEALLVSSVRQHELTEQAEKAEAALRESEERFRRLANAMPQIAWIINSDNSLEFINERWCAYTGLTVEQTRQSKYYRAAVHADDVRQVKDRAAEGQATGSPYEVEFRLKRAADGAYRWFLGRGVPVTDEQG